MTAAAEPDASLSLLAGPSSPMASSRPTNPFVRFEQHDVEQSIPDRFEEQVRRCPGKPAVKTTCKSLTYAELNRLANQIAYVIVARRGDSNEPVALLFEQSALLIAAILGSLKAGKIYLPLDPLHPVPRNADLLADSSAAIILTDASNCEKAHALAPPEISVLNLHAIGDGIPAGNLASKFAPDRLAYLFYT
jgi:non-ribosomal peptide synthetase component F